MNCQSTPPMPNPMTDHVVLRFSLPQAGDATLVICDALGREVKRWGLNMLSAGPHQVSWNGLSDQGRMVPAGILFYRLTTQGQSLQQKLVHLQ